MAHRIIPDHTCKTCGKVFRPRCQSRIYCTKQCSDQRARMSIEERLRERTQVAPSGCWVWQGARDTKEYGRIYFNGRLRSVHSIAWELKHGPIPEGMEVCHSCDNPPCWNTDHLWLGTHRENMDDSIEKGRHGTRNRPHLYLRGADSFSAQHPERLARGENHGNARINEQIVRSMREQHANGVSISAIARAHNVNWSTANRVVKRIWWRHVD